VRAETAAGAARAKVVRAWGRRGGGGGVRLDGVGDCAASASGLSIYDIHPRSWPGEGRACGSSLHELAGG